MITVVPLHRYYSPAHLETVTAQMRVMGRPRLHAHYDVESGRWYAMEGTHRLRAAERLGLIPILVWVPWPKTRRALERARYRKDGHLFSPPFS